jgi:hypothetical protein
VHFGLQANILSWYVQMVLVMQFTLSHALPHLLIYFQMLLYIGMLLDHLNNFDLLAILIVGA